MVMMMVLLLVITICVILPSLGCDHGNEYYGNISTGLSIKAVGRNTVGIFWDQILHNIDEECLVKVELLDNDARTVEVVEDTEEMREKKAFIVEMNISVYLKSEAFQHECTVQDTIWTHIIRHTS